ncbi:hypothetical protein Gotur_025487 [Gossypium turneri]
MTAGHTLLSGSEKLLLREVFTSVQDSGSLSGFIRTYVFVRFSSPCSHKEMYSPEPNSVQLNIEREFLGKVEDNAAIRVWSEKVQQEKGDSLMEGYVSELWDFTRISVTQNNLQKLKEIWDQWGDEIRQLFYSNYGDLPYLLDVKIQAVDRAYSRAAYVPTFLKKLMSITGMREQRVAAQIKQKRDNKCMPWKNLRDLILAHPDVRKRINIFALSIYGLVIFPKALGHVDEAVSDLFDKLDKRAHHYFWKVEKVSYRVFSENYSPLKELVAIPRRNHITEEKWLAILQNLQEEDVEWRAPWLIPNEILYRCGEFYWVSLLGIWRAVGYAPLLVLRQYRSR